MCGITGYLCSNRLTEQDEEILRRMTRTLSHRGPDDEGLWTDPRAGIGIGFRRLAILDLSPAGRQPMLSAHGRFVIALNGEIYNHVELRAELERKGHRFRGRSDTEVVVEACSAWGPEHTLRKLSGMFAIALWDKVERRLLLARDPIGKKPMYYARMGHLFLFGSELKSLRAHPGFCAEVDRDTLALYLRYGYAPAPHTIYHHTWKLLPGQYATLRMGEELRLERYWDPLRMVQEANNHHLTLSDHEAVVQLDALLRDAVARRMIADVPVGAFLSGGIDSSTVAALMQVQSRSPVKTFTIGFREDGYNEAEAARRVAHHLDTDHTELYVTPKEAQAVIPQLPDIYDEPFADSSQIPTYLVSKLARQQVTVALSGDGGDELFAGYPRYALAERIWSTIRPLPSHARSLACGLLGAIPPEGWDRVHRVVEGAVLRQRRSSKSLGDRIHKLSGVLASRDEDALYHRLVSLWKEPSRIVIDGSEPAPLLPDDPLRELIPAFAERMMFRDLTGYLPGDILVKMDRASMALGLEARSPLLDHRVVEWAWRLPMSLKKRDGESKWLLRQLLYKYVPRTLVDRPKTGFGVPIGNWLRGPLRDWAEGLLDEQRLRREGLLRVRPIRDAWRAHLSGRSNDEYRLWAVLMFQAWRERWMP